MNNFLANVKNGFDLILWLKGGGGFLCAKGSYTRDFAVLNSLYSQHEAMDSDTGITFPLCAGLIMGIHGGRIPRRRLRLLSPRGHVAPIISQGPRVSSPETHFGAKTTLATKKRMTF